MTKLGMVYKIVDPISLGLQFIIGAGLFLGGIGVAILNPIMSPLMVGMVGAAAGLILLLAALKETKIFSV